MLVLGTIRSTDGAPLEGVKIDVWQANDEGFYDVQQKGRSGWLNMISFFHQLATEGDRASLRLQVWRHIS